MNMQAASPPATVRIHADHATEKRLGHWTTARAFEVKARRGTVVIDLRSPRIRRGDIELNLDLDRAAVKLLVADDAIIDHWELAWTGRGQVKQGFHPGHPGHGRRIRLTGQVRGGEVRVQSGGIARLSAICSREYLADARRANAGGGVPTLDDPARSA
jgi:hypothetical protein